jgi:hypothetical protein
MDTFSLSNNDMLSRSSSHVLESSPENSTNWTFVLIITLVVLIGGLYLAKDYITPYVAPYIHSLGLTSKPTASPPSTPASQTTTPSTMAQAQPQPPTTASAKVPQNPQNSLDNALQNADPQKKKQQQEWSGYSANDSYSSNLEKKSGWCYIGDDNGQRACGPVGLADTCMSGQIFPTQEICMSPTLRL